MGDKPDKTSSPATKSGVMPRIDPNEIRALFEGKQPVTVPEIEDLTGITGTLIISHLNEGEDKAKQADDPASER
jgi:hypothetical protein